MTYSVSLGKERYQFADLKTLLAKATPAGGGDGRGTGRGTDVIG
jgi:ethanolamine ammonia-lyase large subunit